MNVYPMVGMMVRMISAYLLTAVLVFSFPDWWLRLISPLVGIIGDATCPYIESLVVSVEGVMMHLQGQISINMTLANGLPLPMLPGSWHKHGGQTLNILILAVAVWAAPGVGMRRRLFALPVMLLTAALVSAYDLAIDTQLSALQVIGTEWLSSLDLAQTMANKAAFDDMESWYRGVRWINAFNDGGGRLFLAVLAGLIGFTRGSSWRAQTTLGQDTPNRLTN